MDNIISEKKNLDRKIKVYSSITAIIMFVIMGNLGLITTLFSGASGLSRDYVLKKGFSLSMLDIAFLYITLGYFTYTVLKRKKFILRDYIKVERKSESILIEELKFINKVVFISVISNLIIKVLLYFIFKGTLVSSFNILASNLFLSLIYMTLVSSIVYLLVLISYVSIKDFFSGAFAYCLIFAVLNLVLSTGSLFVSKKVSFVQNILSVVYNIYNPIIVPFYDFSYIYTFNILKNIVVTLSLGSIVLAMIYILKNSIENLNKKNIKEFYISDNFRKLFYLSIAIIIGYFVFAVGFLLLISFSLVDYDNGLLIINLVQVVFTMFVYFKLDKVYLNKHSKNKKEIDKTKDTRKEEILLEDRQRNKKIVDNHILNKAKENKERIIKNKEILERTLIFKPTGLKSELEDCERIKDFSFNELDEYLINQDKADYLLENKSKTIKNEVLNNKEIEVDIDKEKLIDFLKEDYIIESKN